MKVDEKVDELAELARRDGDEVLRRACEAARRGDERAIATIEEMWLVLRELHGSNETRAETSGSSVSSEIRVSYPVRRLRTG